MSSRPSANRYRLTIACGACTGTVVAAIAVTSPTSATIVKCGGTDVSTVMAAVPQASSHQPEPWPFVLHPDLCEV